jgi:HlyD family secretion protein
MKGYILPIVACIAVLAAAMWTHAVRPKHIATLPSAPPPESPSAATVAGVGLVEPESENVELSCSSSGMVTALYVKAGDPVHKGQRLFAVDDRELQGDLGVKHAALKAMEARLHRLQQAPRAEEIPPSVAKVEEAKAQLGDAEVQVKLIESVTDSRAVKAEDVQRRRLNLEAAKARLEQAEKDLALLKAGTWGPDIDVAKSDVAQAAAAVRQDEINLSRLTVTAPVDGIILQNKVRLGQFAQCGPLADPLMVFGGGSNLHLRTDIDENDAWRVRPGATALARLRGASAVSFPLEFVRVEPYVVPKKSLTGDATERVDTRVLQVIYRFKDPQAPVYDGQQMDVYIQAPPRSDAMKSEPAKSEAMKIAAPSAMSGASR